MSNNNIVSDTQRWVVKIGSSLITNDGQGLNLSAIKNWMNDFAVLHSQNIELILVSLGNIFSLFKTESL